MGTLPRQTKRRDLIKRLGQLGFEGPYVGSGKHPQFMVRGDLVLKLPNEHSEDIGLPLLKMVLREAGISPEQWLRSS